MTDPLNVLRAAIQQVPAVKYALAVAGVAAASALVIGFAGGGQAGIIALSVTFIAMILMFVFSRMATHGGQAAKIPSILLIYSVTSFFCIFLIFTVTSAAFYWPRPFAKLLGFVEQAPAFSTLKGGPVTLQAGETRGFDVELARQGPINVIVDDIVADWTGLEEKRAEWMQAGKGNTIEIWFSVCSLSEGDSCPKGVQRGINGMFSRELPAGFATVTFLTTGIAHRSPSRRLLSTPAKARRV